jgi:hypothetical protein
MKSSAFFSRPLSPDCKARHLTIEAHAFNECPILSPIEGVPCSPVSSLKDERVLTTLITVENKRGLKQSHKY